VVVLVVVVVFVDVVVVVFAVDVVVVVFAVSELLSYWLWSWSLLKLR
jgi:hypothetical protein